MLHDTPLISTIVIGLCLAFLIGTLAQRIRVSPIAGYLLAGVALGPYTPGFVADQSVAGELAEIGVILLMFGVGLHFSLRDLWSVRNIAIPGAIAQITAATLLGAALALILGWSWGAALVFGLALSVASTVVLLRALQERRLINAERGRIAVGWLIVEDIITVVALVLLPTLVPLLAGGLDGMPSHGANVSDVLITLAITVGKIAAFLAVMLVVGRRVIPWALHYVAHTGSRELFRLAVLTIALGAAFGAARLFGVSFALGAFFAGMILSESALSQQAASEILPLRDAFAVLFFISVGMLFDPSILVREALPVLATVAIIVLGKSLAALVIVLAFRHPLGTALTVSASLAQIGEFSFILAGLGIALGVLPGLARELVLAGAIISIILNPLLFLGLDRLLPWLEARENAKVPPNLTPRSETDQSSLEPAPSPPRTIVVGYGHVGYWVGETLARQQVPIFVIDESDEVVARLKARNIDAVAGNAVTMLSTSDLAQAKTLFVAIANSFEAGQVVAQARAANKDLLIIARAHSDAEAAYLSNYGASVVVQGAREIANAMVKLSHPTP